LLNQENPSPLQKPQVLVGVGNNITNPAHKMAQNFMMKEKGEKRQRKERNSKK
jgi:hypothetical protein